MKKQLTLKKLSLFVLTALLFVLLSLAFAFTGTARAFADGEGQPCPDGQHSLGKVFVIEKQTCVSHGVGVRYCDKCGLSFNVVIPADGISHKVDKDGKCSECGTTNVHYVITENLPDNDYVEVGQVEESELQSITIPATVTTKGEVKDVHIAEGAFEGNETIQSVTILGTPEIGAEAFKGCKNLTNVTMKEGTQNIAADAFVGTPFYEKKLKEAKNAENQDELQPISIPIDGGNGSYLLKVIDPTAIKAEPEVRPRRNAAALAEEAEAPKTFTYTVAGGTQVIAEKAFEGLANLVEVTLNADLLTVGANAFDGCSRLKTIYIAENAAETSFTNVAGLAPFNTIYYRGGFAEKLFSQLADVIRYFSAAEPTDNAHTYWHFVEVDGVELPTIWNKAVEIQLDTSKCTTRFRKGEPFSSKNLVVKVRYENETQLKEVTENITIDSTEYKADELGEYTITVSYLTYLKTTYTVKVDNAYTITINYGYDGMPSETELVFVSEGFTLPAAPSRTGYKFLGWKVGEEEELRGAGEKITPTADVTVTAQWEQLYRVTAQAANATTGLSETRYYQDGTTVTFTVTPDNGYKLVSVKNGDNTLTAQDGKYSVTVNKADIVITVETTAVTVTATAKEGTVAKKQNGDTAIFTLTPPTKSGFRFDGWTVKIDNAEPVDVDGNTYELKLANADVKVEFAAKWTEMLLTEASATLQLNGNTLTFIATVKGNGFDLETIKDVKLQLGAENPIIGTAAATTNGFTLTYTLTGLTTKEYTLKFVLGTKDVYANKTISGTVTLTNTENTLRYALANDKLTVTEPLTVTFVVEHGTNLTRSVFAGDTLDLDEIEPAPVEGYVFLYWYTTDEEGTETKQSGEITVNSAMTINAKMGDEVTASVSIADYAKTAEWTDSNNGDHYYTTVNLVEGKVTATMAGNGAGYYSASSQEWRMYDGKDPANTLTIAASNDQIKIVSVKVTYSVQNGGHLKGSDGTVYNSNDTITVNAQSVTFGVVKTGTSSGTAQVRIKSIEVTYGVVLTDQEKIDMALESVSSTYTVGESGDYPLPESPFADVAFTWEVLTENSPYGIVNGDHLDIKELPHDTDKQIQLKLTASYNSVEVSKTITVTVKKQIKLAATEFETTPFSELKAKVATSGQTTTEKFYAIGAVKSASSKYNSEIYITNEENEDLYVYGILTEDGTQTIDCSNGVTAFNIGDTIVVYGQMTNYKGTIEMQYAWLVQVNTDAKTNPAKVVLDGITVPDTVSENFELPTVNDTVTWSVASGEGITVSGNQATVTRTADEQTVVLKATTTVGSFTENKEFTVKVQRYVEGLEEIVVTADTLLSGVSGYKNNGTATIDGYGFSWIGMGNYNLLQMRTNSSTGTSSFWNTAAFQYDIIKVTFEWASGKTLLTKADALKVEFSNSVEFEEGATTSKTITFEENTYELTVEGSYKFVRITHNCSNTVYLDKVTIACQDSTEPEPTVQEIVPTQKIDFYDVSLFYLYISTEDFQWLKEHIVTSVKVNGAEPDTDFTRTFDFGDGQMKTTTGFMYDGYRLHVYAKNARDTDVTTFELEWYNEAGELVARTTAIRDPKLKYDLGSEITMSSEENQLKVTFNVSVTQGSVERARLQIGNDSFTTYTFQDGTLTFTVAPNAAWDGVMAVKLFLNDEEYTGGWASFKLNSPAEEINGMTFTLQLADGVLQLKVVRTTPVEKSVDFNGGGAVYEVVGGRNRLLLQVKTTGYTSEQIKAAYITVNGKQFKAEPDSASTPGANGAMFFYTDGIGELSNGQYPVILHIGDEEYTVHTTSWGLPADPNLTTHEDNGKTITLMLVGDQQDKNLEITITGGEEPVEILYEATSVELIMDGYYKISVVLNVTNDVRVESAILTIGEKTIELSNLNDSKTLTFTVELSYLTKGVQISLTVNGVAPQSWPGTVTGNGYFDQVSGEDYSLDADGDKLKVKIVSYGSLDNPLTISEAVALAADECVNKDDATAHKVYAQGKITNVPELMSTYLGLTVLADLEQEATTIEVKTLNYTQYNDYNGGMPYQNDTITVLGFIKKLDDLTNKFATHTGQYVYTQAMTRGESTITITNEGNATVNGLNAKATNATEVNFTVTPPQDKKVQSVTAYGEVLAEESGSYKFTVAGDGEVVITLADASTPGGETEPKEVSFTPTDWSSLDNQAAITGSKVKESVTFTTGGTSNSVKYYSAGYIQMLQGAQLIFKVETGYKITGIKLTYQSGYTTDTDITATEGTYKSGAWSGSAQSVTLTRKSSGVSQLRCTKIAVTYIAGNGDQGGGQTEPGGEVELLEESISFVTWAGIANPVNQPSGTTNNFLSITTTKGFKFSAEQDKGSTAPAYNKDKEWRLYAKNKLTITAPDGFVISTITFTYNAASSGKLQDETQKETYNSTDTVTVEKSSVIFMVSSGSGQQVKLKTIVIKYVAAASDQGMEGPSMTAFTANMNNGNVESNGLWIALAVGGSALIALSALAVVVLLRKHN